MSITINAIATNDIINAAETGVAITGTNTSGATVTLTIGGVNRTATVTGATWSYTLVAADIANMGEGSETITATATVAGASSTSRNIFVDTVPPTVAITDNIPGPGDATGLVTFTFTFSDPVTNFFASDIVVTGGAKRAFAAVSPTVYTLQVLPTAGVAAGAITVNVPANAAFDAAGNGNAATTPATQGNQPYNTVVVAEPIATNPVAITAVVDDHGTIQGNLTSGGKTSDNRLDLSGTLFRGLNAGDVVKVYDGGTGTTALGPATVSGNTWVYADTRVLSDGQMVSYSARVENGATVGTESAAFTTTVDRTPPPSTTVASITSISDDVTPQAGIVTKGGTFNDNTPQINGTLSATLGAGEVVHVYRANPATGIVTDLGVATMLSATSWTFYDNAAPLVFASGTTYRYQARVVDAAGNVGVSDNGYMVSYDTVVSTPALTGITQDRGVNATDRITSDTGLFFSGTAEAGATVRVYETSLGGLLTSTATTLSYTVADGLGNWVFNYSSDPLPQGNYTFTAQQTDLSGNISANSAAFNVTIDTSALSTTAAIGTVVDNLDADHVTILDPGINLAGGGYTNDLTPTLNGYVSSALSAGDMVAIYDGTTRLGTATMTSPSTWTFTDGITRTLVDGQALSYTAVVEDIAGNSAASLAFALTIDNSAPGALTTLVVKDSVGLIKGDLKAMGSTVTDDNSLELSGVLDARLLASEVLVIYNGSTKLGDAIIGSDGYSWTYADATGGATRQYDVFVVDAAGNKGAVTQSASIAYDAAPPTRTADVTGYDDNVPATIGNIASGGTSNDSTPLLSGTISPDALVAGESVAVFRNGTTYIGDAVTVGTNWTFQDSAVPNGLNSYTVAVRDLAGNAGTVSPAYTVTLDDGVPAMIAGGTFNVVPNSVVALPFSEALDVTSTTAGLTILQNNGGPNIVTGGSATGANLNVNTNVTLAQTNWLMVTYDQSIAGGITDSVGNEPNSFTWALGGTGTNTIDLSGFTPTLGLVTIEGGAGVDTLTGTSGNDTFAYSTSAEFVVSGVAVVDTVVGGTGTDTIQIAGQIDLAANTDLSRAVGVERLAAASSSTGGYAHTIVLSSALLSSIRTIDLSANTGASNATINLAGVSAAADMTITGLSNGTNTITAGLGKDSITGGSANDSFSLAAGTGLTSLDTVNGGAGIDTVNLTGANVVINATDFDNVSNIEVITHANTTANISITTKDALVASGATLTLNASGLSATNSLKFLGNSETNGAFSITGGAGNDTIAGGAGNDTIIAGAGIDVLSGGAGNNVFSFVAGTGLTSLDTVKGEGIDTVALTGTVATAVDGSDFNNVYGIRAITHQYTATAITIVATDDLVGGVTVMSLSNAGNTGALSFNGAAETDGSYSITGGKGSDSILGGSRNDIFVFNSATSAFAKGTTVDGGNGTDTISFTGDFLVATGATISNIEVIKLDNFNNNATFQMADAVVSAGAILSLDASSMTGTATLNFNGAAELDGSFSIVGGSKNDTIAGGSGNDILSGGAGGNDNLSGGAGNDTFYFVAGGTFNNLDTVNGGTGVDTLVLTGTGAVASGDFANVSNLAAISLPDYTATSLSITTIDALVAAGAVLTLNNSKNSGQLVFSGGAELNGSFNIVGGSAGDSITGGSGNDTFVGGAGKDTLAGGAGNDTYYYAAWADFFSGGAVVDSFNDTAGTADMIMVAGPITVLAGDLLSGAANIEQLAADAYSGTTTAQTHTITGTTNLGSLNAFNLSGDANAGSTSTINMSGVLVGTALTGVLNGTNTLTSGTGVYKDTITGGNGNDTISSGDGDDTINAGAGNDKITLTASMLTSLDTVDGGAGYDTLVLDGNSAMISSQFSKVSNIENITLLNRTTGGITIATADALLAAGATLTFDASSLTGTGTLNFSGAAETDGAFNITAGNSNSAGDSIVGGAGNDIFTFVAGSGLTNLDTVNGNAGIDTVALTGDNAIANTNFANVSNIEVITVQNSTTSIAIDATLALVAAGATLKLDASSTLTGGGTLKFNGAAETVGGGGSFSIVGGSGADSIVGGVNDDTLFGGAGADTLTGGNGNDTYQYSKWADFYPVVDVFSDSGGTADRIQSGGSIKITTADTLPLAAIEQLSAMAGTTLQNNAHSIIASAGNLGSVRSIDLSGDIGDTSTAVIDLSLMAAATSITGVNGAVSTNNITSSSGIWNDTITGGAGNDTISSGLGNDNLNGGAGHDTFIFVGGTGLLLTDTVDGGLGIDTVILTGGAATATSDFNNVKNIENITLSGYSNVNVAITTVNTLVAAGSTLSLDASSLNAVGGKLTFNGTLELDGAFNITGSTGTGIADSIIGAANLTGGDTFTFVANTGLTSADTVDGLAGVDTVSMTGNKAINATDFNNVKNIELILVQNTDTDVTITTQDALVASGAVLTLSATSLTTGKLKFDGALETKGGLFSITGGAANDTIIGGGLADTLNGGTGGDDNLSGGAGNDTFMMAVSSLNNMDILTGGAGLDTVALTGNAVVASNVLDKATDIEFITVQNTNTAVDITTVTTLVAAGATLAMSNAGNSGQLIFIGSADVDSLFSVTGGSGGDSIVGSSLNDTLDGGAGNDTLVGGLGGDSIVGGDGNDFITFAAGTGLTSGDVVNGGAGSDTLALINDTLTTGKDFQNVSNIEFITFQNQTANVVITAGDLMTAAGATLTVNASSISGAATLLFDGNAEADGKFNITGSKNNDTITGGAMSDTITAGLGTDNLVGGDGADTFIFANGELTSADFVDGDVGTSDTLKFTGEVTYAGGEFTLVTNIESIVLSNMTTNATIAAPDSLAAKNGAISIDASSLTTGVFNFDGTSETNGSYTIIGGAGADTIKLGSATLSDTVTVMAGGSDAAGIDKISNFQAVVTTGDKLDLISSAIAADATGVNGINSGTIMSHAITIGMISFDNTDIYAAPPVVINAANLADVNNYLATNIASGETVAFYVDVNGDNLYNNAADYLRVFQGGATAAGSLSSDDIFVDIFTTTPATLVTALSATAAAATVVIV